MSQLSYQDLITRTFCENAIRSVVMIDDDFMSYDELAKALADGTNLDSRKRFGTSKAASIHRFFQQRKIVCDVDSGTEHLDVDKVRKCDLIILDYHLEHQNPKRSIDLIRALRKNEHMNLVVVYTSEDLNTTWLEIAACLKGGESIDSVFNDAPNALERWNEIADDGTPAREEWIDAVTEEDLRNYIFDISLTGHTNAAFRRKFGRLITPLRKAVCEHRLKALNLVKAERDLEPILGGRDEIKWLQSGNVFIALHAKSKEEKEDDASELWGTLTKALHLWNPSYYRLIVSEIQNWLENEPLPFDTNIARDLEGQAAWLSRIMGETCDIKRQSLIDQLFERLTEELQVRLLTNTKLRGLSFDTFKLLASSAFSAGPVDLRLFSAEHVSGRKNVNTELYACMFHALNSTLCSKTFSGDYVTNGTVLVDTNNTQQWYLCVTPACDAVPEQETSPLASRLAPHRFMKLIVLKISNLSDALSKAEHCRHIFIRDDGGKRIALSAQDETTHNPSIDYALIHNHTSRNGSIRVDGVEVSFLSLGGEKEFSSKKTTLKPVAQLRESYTARYQTVASHHAGRVGVDFVSLRTP